jgi:hypothetical protein
MVVIRKRLTTEAVLVMALWAFYHEHQRDKDSTRAQPTHERFLSRQ